MVPALILAAAVATAPSTAARAVAVARARIISGVRISFSDLPTRRTGQTRLIEFE